MTDVQSVYQRGLDGPPIGPNRRGRDSTRHAIDEEHVRYLTDLRVTLKAAARAKTASVRAA